MASLIDSPLFGDLVSTAEMRAIWDDRAAVQRWLDVEAALARAEAAEGIVPAAAAEEIARCARVERLDLAEMKRLLGEMKHPIMPLIRCLQRVCEPSAGEWIHWGATTQDIMDTGLVLQLRDAHRLIVRDLGRVRARLLALAARHRDTVQAGRTHGQQALPITFGYKVAVWAAEAGRHLERLAALEPRVFRGQLAGAVGTLASLGEAGLAVQARVCAALGLGVPDIAWHTARDGIAEAVCVYAQVGGTLAKIANEVIALQKSELAEVEEPFHMGKIGSSTMPHKRNPSTAEGVVAAGRLLAAQVGPALAGLVAEHERDKRGNLAEQGFVPEACCLLAGMLAHTERILAGLRVDAARMARNLALLGGLLLSESVMLALGRKIGRQRAHDLVYEHAMHAVERGVPLRDLLLADP
ncbi:MAG TPA: adenylosuccinate lyase family protein, partial [Candidatus Tectomicrobia bacterium]|nr:adenylosuccinate lyase family protein [Candidatus Tectomicrobia bacterium]